jgi:hypothetical protein
MKITIETTQSVQTEIELPDYFTTLKGWYYMVLPDNKVLHVSDSLAEVNDAARALKHCTQWVAPCNEADFVQAYTNAINAISEAYYGVTVPKEASHD